MSKQNFKMCYKSETGNKNADLKARVVTKALHLPLGQKQWPKIAKSLECPPLLAPVRLSFSINNRRSVEGGVEEFISSREKDHKFSIQFLGEIAPFLNVLNTILSFIHYFKVYL